MFKKFESDVRRKVKEIMAVALSFCLLFGTLGMPIKVTAAGGGDDYFDEGKITPDTVLFAGDQILFDQTGDSDTYNRKSLSNIYYSLNGTDYSVLQNGMYGAIPFAEISGIQYWEVPFTMPVKPADGSYDSYVYVVQSDSLFYNTVIWTEDNSTYEILPVTDERFENSNARVSKTVNVIAYPGVKVEFYTKGDEPLASDERFFVYTKSGTNTASSNESGPSIEDDAVLGEVIGWSNNKSFRDSTQDSGDMFFLAPSFEGHFYFPTTNAYIYSSINHSENGVLKLYPVYKYIETELTVSSNDPYYEGTAPTFNVSSNRPSGRESDVIYEYFKAIDSDTFEAISAAPTEPGDYRVKVTMKAEEGDETYGDESMTGMPLLATRPYASCSEEIDFSIEATSASEVTTAPKAKTLTYNGEEQALVTAGVASHGEMVYSVESEEVGFENEIPMMQEAGTYQVWYKAVEDYRPESEVGELTVTIAQKEVGLDWSDTEFVYDGEEHSPTVTLTGICGEDECVVTVEGSGKEVGTYTAKVTGISNSNYKLPATVTKEFTIVEPTKEDPIVTKKPEGQSLTYSGSAQKLISAGSVDGGDMLYGLSETGDFTSDIPTGKEAGEYTVWYMVKGIEGVNDIAPQSITATISKKTVGLEWSDTEFIYDGKEHCPTATATGLCDGDTCTVTVTGGATVAGKYTATATSLSNSNYALGSDTTQSFEIKEPPVATITEKPAANELTYNGNSQRLVTQGKAEGGVIIFSTSKDGEYSSVIPKAKDAGDYTVWYMAQGEEGIKDSEPSSIKVTIAPKTVGLKWSETEFMYDGKEHCPTVELTDICDGDTCTVKVTGAQKEIGIYTAKATSLSNSNYKLPSDNTKEFSILDPNKKKGVVSVSMASFIYGGRASTPVITSKTNDVSKASVLYKPSSSSDSAYSVTVPTEVGNYTVKVTLPKNEEYNACSATASFSITYLTVGNDAYSVEGTRGKNGFYTTSVTVSPGAGYELSYGDRNHFTGNSIKVEDSLTSVSFYLRNANTGEQTDVISLNNLKIDSSAPQVVNLEKMGVYFASGDGSVKCIVKDKNLDKVVMGDNELKLIEDGGNTYFNIPVGNGRQTVTFTVYDLAGNKTDFSVVVAPSWLENGEIVSGTWYLNANESFTFPEGTTWTVNNGSTVYVGGSTFYVKEPGEYTFTMN